MGVTDDLYKHLKCIFSHCFGILSHLRHSRFENTACKVVPSSTRRNINAPSTSNILGISSCSCLTPNWGDGSISFNISCVSFDRWLGWQRSHLGSARIYQRQATTAVITADSNQYKKVVSRRWNMSIEQKPNSTSMLNGLGSNWCCLFACCTILCWMNCDL